MHYRTGVDLPNRPLHARLVMDHDDLDLFLDRVLAAYRCGDREAAATAFTDLEARLGAHFEIEERHLFPEFARAEPAEIRALRTEHDAIRARLGELGVAIDLHEVQPAAIEELGSLLRRHVARENTLLYRSCPAPVSPTEVSP